MMVLMNSSKQYFKMINKDRAHKLYKEIYLKCIYWIEQFLTMGSKKLFGNSLPPRITMSVLDFDYPSFDSSLLEPFR